MRRIVSLIAAVVLFLSLGASAQEIRSEISVQGTGFFTKDSTGQGTTQRGTESGGFLVGYRYHFNRWLAAETVYGYSRNTQQYFGTASLSGVLPLLVDCSIPRRMRSAAAQFPCSA